MSASSPYRHAVFGQPIGHSLSPRIHRCFARSLGIAITYDAIEATPEHFEAILARFHAAGGHGANVTLPLKEIAARLCRTLSPAARLSGAVNTLVRRTDGWFGDNTDGEGLVRDINGHLGWPLAGARTLLLGAGGAARGVVPALFGAGIATLVVSNRSPERARALATDLAECGPIETVALGELETAGRFDVVINATSAARQGVSLAVPDGLVDAGSLAYDLSYGEAATPFLDWAGNAGAGQRRDGLGMLVEQAAEAFSRWHGMRPAGARVLADLRAAH